MLSWLPTQLVDPRRTVGSAVADPDGLISATITRLIESAIKTAESDTRLNQGKGVQLSVAVIDKMAQKWSVANFAMRLFENWGIGSRATNNGLLLFLAIKDRAATIRAGAGIEKVVDTAARQEAIAAMRPLLQAGSTSQAVLAGVTSLISTIKSKQLAVPPPFVAPSLSTKAAQNTAMATKASGGLSSKLWLFIGGIVLVVLILNWFSKDKPNSTRTTRRVVRTPTVSHNTAAHARPSAPPAPTPEYTPAQSDPAPTPEYTYSSYKTVRNEASNPTYTRLSDGDDEPAAQRTTGLTTTQAAVTGAAVGVAVVGAAAAYKYATTNNEPAAPAYNEPAARVYSEPAAPAYNASAAPAYNASAAPAYNEPAAPAYNASAAPTYNEPAAPAYNAQQTTALACAADDEEQDQHGGGTSTGGGSTSETW